MKRLRPLVISIATILLLSGFCVIPANCTAEVTYWLTTAPSAYNSSYWTIYPKYASTPVESEAVKTARDGSTLDLYTSSVGLTKCVETNDFTDNDSWVYPGPSEYATPVGYLPPDNATIITVHVLVWFTACRPDMTVYLSTTNKSSWSNSGPITGSSSIFYGIYQWNVTSLRTWTPAMLNDTDTWVKIKAIPTAGIHYYLDYLGFFILWSADLEGGGMGGEIGDDEEYDPEGDTQGAFDFDFIFDAGGIVGILGVVGFLGMIAVPPLAMLAYKTSNESRLVIFVRAIVSFMFCLSLFLVSLG